MPQRTVERAEGEPDRDAGEGMSQNRQRRAGRSKIVLVAGGLLVALAILGLAFWLSDDEAIRPVDADEQAFEAEGPGDGSRPSVDAGDTVAAEPLTAVRPIADGPATPPTGPYGGLSQDLDDLLAGLDGTRFLFAPGSSNDSVVCSGESPPLDRSAEISGVVGAVDGDMTSVLVRMLESPLGSSEQFSWTILVTVIWPDSVTTEFIWETRDGLVTVGERDQAGLVDPFGVEAEVRDDSVLFRFPTGDAGTPALVIADSFGTQADGEPVVCDNLFAAADPFPWANRAASGSCLPDGTTSCLNGGRHAVQVMSADRVVSPVGLGLDDAERFDTMDGAVLVRVLDGCSLNDRFWVFATGAGAVDVNISVTFTDPLTDESTVYQAALSTGSGAVTDTLALATCTS